MRKLIYQRKLLSLIWLLVLSVFIRSLIAPGFMLDTGGDGPFDLSITICNGPNGINSIDGLEPIRDKHHNHHGIHGENDSVDHDHEGDHFTATCGLWSASGTFISGLSLDTDFLPVTGNNQYLLTWEAPYLRKSYQQLYPPRAPPLHRIS